MSAHTRGGTHVTGRGSPRTDGPKTGKRRSGVIYYDVELLLWARVLLTDQDPLDARTMFWSFSLFL